MKESSDTSKVLRARELGVSVRSLYYQPKEPDKEWSLKCQIEEVLRDHPSYGHRQLSIHLGMNKKKVLRIMHLYGIKPYRKRGRKYLKSKKFGYNILARCSQTLPSIPIISE